MGKALEQYKEMRDALQEDKARLERYGRDFYRNCHRDIKDLEEKLKLLELGYQAGYEQGRLDGIDLQIMRE